ncbi:MAG TPA: hypothetical protein PKV08_04365, partial [Candidatus Syntrophosphaera thermopropionivorans]|nr:hypothetical protein [Candidatus Syntrophosphaera thermopropionivorans]
KLENNINQAFEKVNKDNLELMKTLNEVIEPEILNRIEELENKSMDKLEEQGKVIIHINKMLNSAIAILLLLGVIILVLIFSMFQ